MVEMKINASEIKNEGKDTIKNLANFLKEKTNAEVTTEAETVTVKGEGEAVSKKYLRVLVKKFLHNQELKEYYRVIADEENTLKVKERKLYEEKE
ncbi:60S ribosomal protein L22 [Candidatus Bathyarchaeota archaeon]|nr:60S ribosomal protein L22 [Candidatus Bathyarchaeota archaeon]